MFSFESKFINTDITSVKILRNQYLVGVGGYVHIYDKKSCKFVRKINVFQGQKIYEIIPDAKEIRVLLYGGRYIKVIAIDERVSVIYEPACKTATDWILAAKWIDDHQQIATVSMHNRVQIWNTDLELITEINCEEKCILYSAFICYDTYDKLIILSGTVFSEVLIWKPNNEQDGQVLKRLQKHKGVIFCVHYNETSGYICSSSDDRSSVLWKPKHKTLSAELERKNIEINIACHVFGHLSRVFRCHVLDEYFLTGGEDSLLNIWSLDGQLVRKIETHQGGPIWAIDANENDNVIITGGSDCAATLFPINCNFKSQELSLPDKEAPKNVRILSRDNLVVVSERGTLYYYTNNVQKWFEIERHRDLSSYALVTVSKCRNLIALAGFYGQIYIYRQQHDRLYKIVSSETSTKSRIFALHWINCTTFLICQTGGKMTLYLLKNDNIVPVSNFILPPSKEPWSTTAIFTENHLVVGDRKGNLHLFEFGKSKPVHTLKKVHSHLGVTNLIKQNDKIISLGRNSKIKTFTIKNGSLQVTSSNKLPYSWLVNIVEDLLLAFSGNKFVLWNHKTKRLIFEKCCGGGHRSWDFLRTYNNALFSYVKDKVINVIDLQLNNFSPADLIEGYQAKEINSISVVNVCNHYVVISGGEDTTLRVNVTNGSYFTSIVSLKPHLSSIRTIISFKVSENQRDKETYLVFSGGGRAQIICWKLEVFIENDRLNNIVCSEQHSYYKTLDTEESETRIMDLTVVEIKNQLLLFAACSDGNVKIFFINRDESGKYCLQFHRDVFYKLKCILKLCHISISTYNILVTMATDGLLSFWNVSNICKGKNEVKCLQSVRSHQSGINSYDFKLVTEEFCVFLTGGDDNAIVLNLIRFQYKMLENVDIFRDSGTHCAQITGVFLSDNYFLTASIDQRITVFEWKLIDEKLICKYITRYDTCIADVQGICCFENRDFDTFIYGKGIEYIKIKKKS